MRLRLRFSESHAVFCLSVFFLLNSTLTFASVETLMGLRYSQVLIVTAILALALTYLFRNKLQESLSISNSASRFRFDFLIVLLLFLCTLAILTFSTNIKWMPLTDDETFHLRFTGWVYKAVHDGDYKYLARLGNIHINPLFPYLLTVTVIRQSDFSLLSGRMLISMIASFVPPVLYFLAREYCIDRKISALTALALSFSSLFQTQAGLYVFDGVSTLLFTTSFFLLVRAVKRSKKLYFLLSGLFFYILLWTKYPPSIWLLIIYIFTMVFLAAGRKCPVRIYAPLIAIVLSIFPLAFYVSLIFPYHEVSLTRMVFYGWGPDTLSYAITTLWDLTYVLGWSPYLIVTIISYKFVRSKDKSLVTLISLLAILLAFLTLVPYLPVTRRIIQAVPVFFVTTMSYAWRRYSKTTTAAILLNLSWWGILRILFLVSMTLA